ncbi:sister chromatid cohesion protein DCC1-like [Bolinopsis microptera]|uniref:sister chromatid cohesion protein DCC1-like n=1 Tax=Bolinopsis microptera TaxID=2820187 RepID=UPI0030790E1A
MLGDEEEHSEPLEEVLLTEEEALREAVTLRSEEAGVEIARSTQVLYFDEEYGKNDVRLIELSPEMLNILKEEKSFVLRGDGGEEAVLCTTNKTYTVRECTTSNSLLLTPELAADIDTSTHTITPRRVASCNFVYYELKLCRAKLDKMRDILNRSAYSGEENETKDKGEKVTIEDLLSNIQASEQELKEGLDELGAIEMNGYWRVVEHEYKTSAVSRILTLLEEMNWSWEKVPLIQSCHTLADLQPRFVTELCLRLYGNQVSETEDEVLIKLCEDKICRFYGQYILSSSAGKFNLTEFVEVWQDSLPDGMTADMTYLRGLALVNKSSTPHTISYLAVSDLPIEPARRFAYLFSRQEKWSHDDVIPYLEDLIGPGQTVTALLLKHCRSTTDHKTKLKVYNSKTRS